MIHLRPSLPVSWSDEALKVILNNPLHQLVHLLLYLKRDGLFVGQVAFLKDAEVLIRAGDKALYGAMARQGLEHTVDPSALVLAFRVGQKEHLVRRSGSGRKINQYAVFPLPNGMELCFEPDLPKLGNQPADVLFAAIGEHMLFNNRETFQKWLINQGLVADIQRCLTGHQLTAE